MLAGLINALIVSVLLVRGDSDDRSFTVRGASRSHEQGRVLRCILGGFCLATHKGGIVMQSLSLKEMQLTLMPPSRTSDGDPALGALLGPLGMRGSGTTVWDAHGVGCIPSPSDEYINKYVALYPHLKAPGMPHERCLTDC